MKKVAILAMQNSMAFSIISPMDVFFQAGVMWNYFHGQESTPFFDVRLVTSIGRPFTCLNGARMVPDGSIDDVEEADLVVVSSIKDIEKNLREEHEVIDWIKDRYRGGAHIAAICSGAFVLAETGLLDGKTATTHWAFADQFRRRYPRIELKAERLITDEGDLFCSGGYSAAIDLSLYLVEKYCGREVALQSSKSLVSDMNRTSQAAYASFQYRKDHGDGRIIQVQERIEHDFEKNLNYDDLARSIGLSRRTLIRRFKTATGETPLTYQQNIRIEAAKRLLEKGILSFDEITYQVGYEDSSTFRKVFSKRTGLTPKEYRRKFRRASVN